MRSVVLCEGKDDLWFIAYFLYKTKGWVIDKNIKKHWPYYKIMPKDHTQDVQCILNDQNDFSSIWAVGGQDRMKDALNDIFRINSRYPNNPIETIVLVKDCDARDHDLVVNEIATWFDGSVSLTNHELCNYTMTVDDKSIVLQIMPIVIPFDSEGAIETVLLHALTECGTQEQYITKHAVSYVRQLATSGKLKDYLIHSRQITKAEYSAAIAITNPDHSTELFKGMVMSCPWEETEAIYKHFGCISSAITSCPFL